MSSPVLLSRRVAPMRADPGRVVIRPFRPGPEPRDARALDRTRVNHILDRVLGMDEAAATLMLDAVLARFSDRHRHLLRSCEARADRMEKAFYPHQPFSIVQRRLVGAFFLHEYAFEAAALFNPSILAHPDQSSVPPGARRFLLSLRSVGEGHVSSLTFRAGVIEADGTVRMEPAARFATLPVVTARETGRHGETIELAFPDEGEIGERVISPVTDAQANGIEDVRFVEFDDDGRRTYLATYTAYSGSAIRSELLETSDFRSFRLSPMHGNAVHNKGMALFPRRISGYYVMIGRQDNESLHLMYSDDLLHWEGGKTILRPRYPWEFVQIGNCGAPIELDEGWLLLTHGVGAMREYAIGAVLLDKGDPSRVLGRSSEPLLRPDPSERDGYVPNVVYTCGALRHGDLIVLPYGVCDAFATVATFRTDDLLRSLDRV